VGLLPDGIKKRQAGEVAEQVPLASAEALVNLASSSSKTSAWWTALVSCSGKDYVGLVQRKIVGRIMESIMEEEDDETWKT